MSQASRRNARVSETAAQASAGGQLADRIADDIVASKTPPGTVIASEQELRLRHDAGRSVFRQAVRILEERGVAYMRRGHGGGLVAAAPNANFEGRALSIVLESLSEDLDRLWVLPAAIETHLFVYGAPRLSPERCQELTALIRRLDALPVDEFIRTQAVRQLDYAINTASGEPAVALAYTTTKEYNMDVIPYSVITATESAKGEFWQIECDTIDALVAGDVARMFDCRRRLKKIMQDSRSGWNAMERDPALRPKISNVQRPEFQLPGNQAERLAREILREIRLMGWESGARIGGVAELMERYGVSMHTLRQAARMLQEHSAVEVERGRSGGFFIARPDRQRAIERASAFLRRSAPSPADIRAFLVQLMLYALDSESVVNRHELRRGLGPGPFASFSDLYRTAAAALGHTPALFADILLPFLPPEPPSAMPVPAVLQAFGSSRPTERRRAFLAVAAQPVGAATASDAG